MKLEKLLSTNQILPFAMGTTVAEYDIAAAAPTAYRFILGEEVYKDLMRLPKEERNIKTGKMQIADPTLWKKTEAITLGWFNEFLEINKIDPMNFVETTRDSIMIAGKIPQKLTLEDGKVVFRVKENEGPYSSFFRINDKLVLFDSLKGDLRIKGISKNFVDESVFAQEYLAPMIGHLESAMNGGIPQILKVLGRYRKKYLEAKKPDIYRELSNKNQFKHVIDGEVIYSESIMDEKYLDNSGNFLEYFMSILKRVI